MAWPSQERQATCRDAFCGGCFLKATWTSKPKACSEESRSLSTNVHKLAAPRHLLRPRVSPGWGTKEGSDAELPSEPVQVRVRQQIISCSCRDEAQKLGNPKFISVSLFSAAFWQCMEAAACLPGHGERLAWGSLSGLSLPNSSWGLISV